MKAEASLLQSVILLLHEVVSRIHQVFRDEKTHLLIATYGPFTLKNGLMTRI